MTNALRELRPTFNTFRFSDKLLSMLKVVLINFDMEAIRERKRKRDECLWRDKNPGGKEIPVENTYAMSGRLVGYRQFECRTN